MANPVLSPETGAAGPADNARPVGIAILAILNFIGVAFLLLFGLLALVAGSMVTGMLGGEDAGIGAILGGIIGFVFIAGAIIPAIVGYGLWNGRSWAWYVQLVFTGIGALFNLMGVLLLEPSSFLALAVNGLILWYLFRPEVRRWFGQSV